jgi:uncharacterized membrane protein
LYTSNNFETIIESVFASIPLVHSICYNNLAKIFKIVTKGTALEEKEKIFSVLINLNPYK